MVIVGAAIGAPLRYLIDRAVQNRVAATFPWGTLIVNVLGSLVLGVLTGTVGAGHDRLQLLIGTGFCGALTTYSTFSYETLQLTLGGARLYALANLVATIVVGVGGYATGALAGHWIWG